MKTTIQPILSVRNGATVIEFYCKAFGAVELMPVSSPDGELVAELSVEGADFFIADESPDNENYSPETIGGNSVRLAIVAEDPDSLFAKAITAGA